MADRTDGATMERTRLAPSLERRNAGIQIVASALQKAGDLVVDPKAVLAWLLAGLGAPAAVTGLLVPVRESGSMLPQVSLVPLVRRFRERKWVWVIGAVGQALAVAAMALVAATTTGAVAGWSLLAALAVFALARSLSSIASKDVLGRTIGAGRRGRVQGWATVASGTVAITIGVALQVLGGDEPSVAALAWLLAGAAAVWLVSAAVFSTVDEPPGEESVPARVSPMTDAWSLLRDDRPFRRFVLARSLLLVSALTPPFVVSLATREGGAGLAGLGPFVVSSGVAALVGGRLWGGYADRSSRLVMVTAAGGASLVVLAFLAGLRIEVIRGAAWLYPTVYLLLALAHHGSRIGRKTFVVDLAEGDQRTRYVAVSNAAMGVILLIAGGLSAALATLGPEVALLFLAGLGVAAVPIGLRLPEVSR